MENVPSLKAHWLIAVSNQQKVARPEVLSYNNTLSSLHTTWTEYKHPNEYELMQLLLVDGYMLVAMVMLNNAIPQLYIESLWDSDW